jgi:tRNA 2-selenouridine synthase
MSIVIDVETYLQDRQLPTIDVRSPGEFVSGHIPNAINLPLFDDSERAEVGTLYKKTGRQAAIVRGLEHVGAKANRLLKSLNKTDTGKDFFLHCWRGGMRSEGLAWFLSGCGFNPRRLKGGYKAFRQAARRCLGERRPIIILSGASGAGKTQILGVLKEAGEQVIDLEQLAGHRGSVFGGINRPPQPTVEQFENDLFWQWRDLDSSRPVWIECESQSIGRVFIPNVFWNQMKRAPAVSVEVARDQRVEFLLSEYGDSPIDKLTQAIEKVKKRLGGANLKAALEALDHSDLHAFTEIALDYYDKAYALSIQKRPRSRTVNFQLVKPGLPGSVADLIKLGLETTREAESAGN